MSDLIRREDAIKAVKQVAESGNKSAPYYGHIVITCDDVEDLINVIPSADRPQGEWIDKGRNLWGCSNCGMEIYSESERDRNEFHKWCSRCGAHMKGADNEADNN